MRVSVLLTRQELDALGRLATVERRPPRDQASYLIAEGLRRRGLLPDAPRTHELDPEPKATLDAQAPARPTLPPPPAPRPGIWGIASRDGGAVDADEVLQVHAVLRAPARPRPVSGDDVAAKGRA